MVRTAQGRETTIEHLVMTFLQMSSMASHVAWCNHIYTTLLSFLSLVARALVSRIRTLGWVCETTHAVTSWNNMGCIFSPNLLPEFKNPSDAKWNRLGHATLKLCTLEINGARGWEGSLEHKTTYWHTTCTVGHSNNSWTQVQSY